MIVGKSFFSPDRRTNPFDFDEATAAHMKLCGDEKKAVVGRSEMMAEPKSMFCVALAS